MNFNLIETLRSLGFGALLGSGLLGLAYLVTPNLFPGAATIEAVVTIGGLLGAGAHQLIDIGVLKGVLSRIGGFVGYYSKLVQLAFLGRHLEEEQRRRLLRELTERYFLNETTKKLPIKNGK